MAWAQVGDLQGPPGEQGPPGSDAMAIPAGTYHGSWCDAGGNVGGQGVSMAVTGPSVVTEITQPIGTPVGCSLSAGTVTVAQAGIWNFQGTTQYAGSNTAVRAIYFVQSTSPTASPKYGLFGGPSLDSMATSATFTLPVGAHVSFCTDLWSGSNLYTWKNQGCTIIATWLGNPQQVATGTPPPVVVQLADGGSLVTDASTGNLFRVTIAGNRTLAAPTNPVDGQRIVWEVTASGGNWTLSVATGAGGFVFGSDIPSMSAIASGTTDLLAAIYNASINRWRVVAYTKGF